MSSGQKFEEQSRLAELKSYNILDTPPESSFSDIVYLASTLCESPISLISLIDENRQWFKACIGLNVTETSREVAFCDHVVKEKKMLVIEDAMLDDRFKNNPLVLNEPGIRFYAGVPLFSGEHVLGTLCIIDIKPRALSISQKHSLEALARQVMNQFDLRRALQELNNVQTKLRGENQRYFSLVDHLKEVVFQTDIEGKWTFLSPAWEKILGYKTADCIGKNFIHYIYGDDHELSVSKFAPLIKNECQFCRCEIRYIKSNGDICWVEVFAQPTFNSEGHMIGTTGTITDTTERKEQEKIIEKQRAKMIDSSRLYALGEMAAGIAHEINNPLAIIRGTAQIMDRHLNSPQPKIESLKNSLIKIDTTVGRISKIITGLRAFAREGGGDPFIEVVLSTVIGDALELCQMRFKNSDINIQVSGDSQDLKIECRPVQIAQVLLNLLNNAYDAVSSANLKKIRIEIENADDSVKIKIYDSGIGISQSIQDKIMEPFFSTKDPTRGMGLGLSLSKSIVENHQGLLRYSKEDDWTCFTVMLPKKQKGGLKSAA